MIKRLWNRLFKDPQPNPNAYPPYDALAEMLRKGLEPKYTITFEQLVEARKKQALEDFDAQD